jgi:exopolyphosphatase/guanosine-5'-triphosphate,3'-diphosphate pyrophosphatase
MRAATGDMRLAVADLGSNTFRLVVFTARDGWWKRTDEVAESVRIGEGIAKTHELGGPGMARAQATMEVFAHFCMASGLNDEEIDAVATSAIRDADNAPEFLERSQKASGLNVRVLSREEEARYGYLAAVNSTTLSDGVVLDLGGGSMQLVRVNSRRAGELGSWRMGAVRMTERFLPGDGAAKPKQIATLRDHVARKLDDELDWLQGAGRRLVGIGGTVRNLGAAAQRANDIPEFGVQGFVLTRKMLDGLVEQMAKLPPAERGKVPGIKPARGDIILAGALVIQSVIELGGFESIEITEAGLREGVFFERRLAPASPPLFDDVRRASVLNLAAQYDMHPNDNRHVRHVVRIALGLFDELAEAGLHPGDPRERELLWASCVLHDIGMTVDYDDHHKHSRYLILNGGLPGFTPREVALIGQTVRYHRKSMPSLGPFVALMIDGDDARLDRMSTLLRLAEALERSRDQLVREAHVAASDGKVQLELVADGDDRVARWAAGREVELFERSFGRELTI